MGTRSIILVTGAGAMSQHATVRLYRHWDGDPGFNLADIASGIRMARRIFEKSFRKRHNSALTESDIPAEMMAACITAATIDWTGAAAEVDTQEEETNNNGKRPNDCIWSGPLKKDHFGNQSDLEWVYIVDIPQKMVTVYGDGYGDAKHHIDAGPADPMSCLDTIIDKYKAGRRRFVRKAMRKIAATGWTLTPPAVPYQVAVRRSTA